MEYLTVSLPAELIARLRDAVRSGAYASDSEAVRDALQLWEQREQARQREALRLKRVYDDGMASGDGRHVDARTLLAELKAESRASG